MDQPIRCRIKPKIRPLRRTLGEGICYRAKCDRVEAFGSTPAMALNNWRACRRMMALPDA